MADRRDNPAPPRLVPDEPLPPYAFVPGRAPHPRSDPAGHRFGTPAEAVAPLDPERWHESRAYLLGIDLFNAGYYWEAHEAWEGLWHACGRKGALADFLKGLIKLAAAGVKQRQGLPEGVRSHAGRAAGLWREVAGRAGPGPFLGFRVGDLIALADRIHRDGWPPGRPLLAPTLRGQ